MVVETAAWVAVGAAVAGSVVETAAGEVAGEAVELTPLLHTPGWGYTQDCLRIAELYHL